MIDFDFKTNKACAQWLLDQRRQGNFHNLKMNEDGSTIYHSEFAGVEEPFSYWCHPVSGFSINCDFLLVFVGRTDGLLVAVDNKDDDTFEYRLACKKATGLPKVLLNEGYEVNKPYDEETIKNILRLLN